LRLDSKCQRAFPDPGGWLHQIARNFENKGCFSNLRATILSGTAVVEESSRNRALRLIDETKPVARSKNKPAYLSKE
jgi:hypothetical protein